MTPQAREVLEVLLKAKKAAAKIALRCSKPIHLAEINAEIAAIEQELEK